MKTITLIIFFIMPSVLYAQNTLTIKINNLRNNKGQVILELQDQNQNKIDGYFGEIDKNESTITIKNLKPGKYAFKYFHDENKNKKLDLNFVSIPKEGYGFSNNASGKFGPPSFEKTIFTIKKSLKVYCTPNYIIN